MDQTASPMQDLSRAQTITSALEKEIEQYDSLISLLRNRAAPFLSQREEVSNPSAVPEAPVNELQRLVNRLSGLNQVMHNTILDLQA